MAHKKMAVNRPSYVHPDDQDFRNAKDDTAMSVFGGHRQGKRKRGTSVTKRKPREQVRAYRMDVLDEDGTIIALGVDTVVSKPTREELTEAQWNGLEPIPLRRAMPDAVKTGKTLGTSGNLKLRSRAVSVPARTEPTAVHRFITVCNEILARPVACRELPEDYVPRTYAKSKALPPDPWGRV